ncbi:MAG: tetratricopeptide repeat protein [Bacteroidales bacterium]|jgi:tetratricopeptide (TPR) repeat protein|nr:tetratricopeptide repeat protein [Bacteroidales bacterium]
MKKITLIFTALCALFLTACENPSKSRIYTEEGAKLLLRYSQFDEAEETLTKAIQYDKSNYEAYFYRGCAKVNAQKYEEAIADFEKAVELKSDYADAYFNMGRAYYLLNNEDKACENYKLAARYGRPNLEDYLKRCN